MCCGKVDAERKQEKEATGWGPFILRAVEKSGLTDARHLLSYQGDKEKCGQRGHKGVFYGPRWECCESEKNGFL